MILLIKFFEVREYISPSTGIDGRFKVMEFFIAKLFILQNQLVVIPNGEVSKSNITSFTELGTRRTWYGIGVSFDADLRKAKTLIMDIAHKNELAF